MQLDEAFLDAVGVTSERLFGYIYAGTLTLLSAWLIDAAPIEHRLRAAGSLVGLIILLGVGSGVFGVYYRIFGSLILFPLTHWLHRAWDRVRGKTTLATTTSTMAYLRYLGVTNPEAAYLAIKDSFAPARSTFPVGVGATATETRFFHAHGEVHFLYLTTVITCVAVVFVSAFRGTSSTPWFIASAVAYLGALIADIRLHSAETVQMRSSEAALREFLAEHGYL